MNIEIRLITREEVATLREIRLRSLREEPRAFLVDAEEFEKLPLENVARSFNNAWIACAFENGKAVGMSGLYRHSGKKLAHKGTVWGVYVAPEARGQGLGRKLITLLLDEALKAGIELVTLSTDVKNSITVELYQSLGFAPSGIEMHILKLPDGSYVDDVQMIKFLKE